MLAKKEVVYFCTVLLITKCMRAEIKGDEKLLIDLEGPNDRAPDEKLIGVAWLSQYVPWI